MWQLTGGTGLTAALAWVCAGRRARLCGVGLLLGRKREQAGCEVGGQVSYFLISIFYLIQIRFSIEI
jgi:hypothetical protein